MPRTPVSQKDVGLPVTEGLGRQPVPTGDVPHRRLGMAPSLGHPKLPSAALLVLRPQLNSDHPAPPVLFARCAEPQCQGVVLAGVPILSISDGPAAYPSRIPRSGNVRENCEPMPIPCQPKGRPLTPFSEGRKGALPPGPPPTGYGARPLESGGEKPTGQGLWIGGAGPSLARVPNRVVWIIHPGGDEAFPLRCPGPKYAAPGRHPSSEGRCAPPHTPPIGLKPSVASKHATPDS